MFKRPRLSAPIPVVNASLAACLLLLTTACSQSEPAETGTVESEDMAQTAPDNQPPASLDSLPAVWATTKLEGKVAALGIAGGIGSTFAVAYEGGGLQLFDFDGERVTQVSDHDVMALSEGRFAQISGTPVTFFPGLDSEGDLKLWIHGGELTEAIEYDLPIDQTGPAAGLCTALPLDDTDGLLRLAYWTDAAPRTLQSGRIVEVGDELGWLPDDAVDADQPITSCSLTRDGAVTFAGAIAASARLDRNGRQTLVTLNQVGGISVVLETGDAIDVDITDGITVRAPNRPTAITATGDARGGGYPGGIIVIAGEVSNGDHRAVLIDPSKITMTPIVIPPGR